MKKAHQKSIGKPLHERKQKVGNNANRVGVDSELVSERPGRGAMDARGLSIIDVGNRLNVVIHPSEYRCKREEGSSVSHECPLDAALAAIDGIEQCDDTSEEEKDYNPWNDGQNRRNEHETTNGWVSVP